MLITIDIMNEKLPDELRQHLFTYIQSRLTNVPTGAGVRHDAQMPLDRLGSGGEAVSTELAEFEATHLADLTLSQVQRWMDRVSDTTKSAVRLFAEFGPVIDVSLLYEAGVTNVAHFQSRTTVRTRTITGSKDLFLLAWDRRDDAWPVDPETKRYLSGRYAVSNMTYQSLRQYFRLD